MSTWVCGEINVSGDKDAINKILNKIKKKEEDEKKLFNAPGSHYISDSCFESCRALISEGKTKKQIIINLDTNSRSTWSAALELLRKAFAYNLEHGFLLEIEAELKGDNCFGSLKVIYNNNKTLWEQIPEW